jgi:catechol 2,3-dioxygenase-like lactoylglutathione lyase family enzyme
MAILEHVNFTVRDAEATAALYGRLFGWKTRWAGDSIHGGRSLHVGTDSQYVALYQPVRQGPAADESYFTTGGLNHIGVLVEDLDAMEARVRAEGLEPHSHADYEPGRRFYFDDPDGIEIEVISYA